MHLGKGRTGRRSLHRQHGPHVQDRTSNANLPAGKSTAGSTSTGLSVPQPLGEAQRGLPDAVLARHPEGCRLRGGSRERLGICAAPGRAHPRSWRAPEAAAVPRQTRQTTLYAQRGWHAASSGHARRRRSAPTPSRGAPPGSHLRAGLPALSLRVSTGGGGVGCRGDTDHHAPMRTLGLGGGSGHHAVL